jgi:biopolymer transport protein TolR
MSMDVGGAKGGLKADINVTPLVDVMLVLLIIMMLIAPMLQKGVDVKLPLASNTADKPESQEQTVVAVDANKQFYLNSIRIREDDLTTQITSLMENRKEKIVLIKGDEDAPYSAIMAAMDRLRAANIENIGLITERKIRPGESGGQ